MKNYDILGQMHIFDFLSQDRPKESKKTEAVDSNICKYSGHTCNKKELWNVADSLDETMCPHVCCRACSTKMCGARCNGSKEPQEAPMLLQKGDIVYQVLRADIYTWIVDGRTWSYETKNDGPGRGYDLIDEEGLLHSTCWNSSLGSGFFTDYEEAVKELSLIHI